jgi:hypothetical protein
VNDTDIIAKQLIAHRNLQACIWYRYTLNADPHRPHDYHKGHHDGVIFQVFMDLTSLTITLECLGMEPHRTGEEREEFIKEVGKRKHEQLLAYKEKREAVAA